MSRSIDQQGWVLQFVSFLIEKLINSSWPIDEAQMSNQNLLNQLNISLLGSLEFIVIQTKSLK